ncbi:hypothetical protein P389DRAFT_192404 [Cystobasidium minutum MCA 4210]|uniref:uncharacterized protein n=1 Tax=Cystobasidium minutum MCA 4210 TaxID=1397322 RepID=UPI0034CE0A10|eukprot:jgi/Rhomi1/192404/gm1.618_g
MRLSSAVQSFLLLLTALLLVAVQAQAAEEGVQAPLQAGTLDTSSQDGSASTANNDKPKLFKPKTGIMKEEHDVDPSNQRARADEVILENADEDDDGARTIESLEDLSADELLAMLNAAYRHDEL